MFKLACVLVATGVRGRAAAEGGAVARLAPQPHPDEFVTVRRDELHLGDRVVRFWGATLPPRLLMPDAQAEAEAVEAEAERHLAALRFLGVDLLRIDVGPSEGGERKADRWIARARAHGLRLWVGDLSRTMTPVVPADAGVLDDPASDQAWRRAVEGAEAARQGLQLASSVATVWDPRLEILALRRLRQSMRRFNDHTGLRWGDDPTLCIWELAGSERWMARMHAGEWLELPAYFRWLLSDQWNTWLYRRYGSDEALRSVWGTLLPYESLDRHSVLLLPGPLPAALPAAQRPAPAGDAPPAEQPPEDLLAVRRADTRIFLQELWTQHKRRIESQARLWGASLRQAPLLREIDCSPQRQSPAEPVPTALRATVGELVRHHAETAGAADGAAAPRMLLVAPETADGLHRIDGPWRVLTLGTTWSAVCWEQLSEPAADAPTHNVPWRASLGAAGIAFRRQLAIPTPEPSAVRGDLLLQSEALVAFAQSRLLLDADVRFERPGITFAVKAAAADPASPASQTPGAIAAAGALLAPGGSLAQAETLTLFFGADPGGSSLQSLRLAVHAEVLLGLTFTARDGRGPEVRGTVGQLPFEIAIPPGVLRVDFTRDP